MWGGAMENMGNSINNAGNIGAGDMQSTRLVANEEWMKQQNYGSNMQVRAQISPLVDDTVQGGGGNEHSLRYVPSPHHRSERYRETHPNMDINQQGSVEEEESDHSAQEPHAYTVAQWRKSGATTLWPLTVDNNEITIALSRLTASCRKIMLVLASPNIFLKM